MTVRGRAPRGARELKHTVLFLLVLRFGRAPRGARELKLRQRLSSA